MELSHGRGGYPFGEIREGEGLAQAAAATAPSDEDVLRARFYALLAALLVAPPSQGILGRLTALPDEDDTELGRALGALARAARDSSPAQLEEEFNALFVGIGRGELVPFASYYLTGFLHEKPLAVLRDDLARLGIQGSDQVAEPEDHMATLCEVMQVLIEGAFGHQPCLAEQKAFFTAHLKPWAGKFFADLQQAESARFYRAVGALGQVFLDVEAQAFAMTD